MGRKLLDEAYWMSLGRRRAIHEPEANNWFAGELCGSRWPCKYSCKPIIFSDLHRENRGDAGSRVDSGAGMQFSVTLAVQRVQGK